VGLAVSCSAHRNIKARITRDGVWLEQLELNPSRYIPARHRQARRDGVVRLDLNRPMAEIRAELSRHPVKTRLALTGPIVVARDIAHARLKERLDRGEELPAYFRNHPVYYAGPAKTPEGLPSGSFGPTTAGRMDAYVDLFQSHGGSLVMLAKGNRSSTVVDACRKHGGFYLGSMGGPAALLAREHIRKVELIEYPELGMEAIYRIEVVDFPAFILIDDKGNDFFSALS
jgi:fumarate hydratase class I